MVIHCCGYVKCIITDCHKLECDCRSLTTMLFHPKPCCRLYEYFIHHEIY